VAAVTVYSAPYDGRKGRPKHIEHTCRFNKHNTARVASCWFITYIIKYHVFVCALFPVQGGIWTQSTYLPALETTRTQIHDMLPHRS